jgi:eukaryotic-like serine/threonine-protein kinase
MTRSSSFLRTLMLFLIRSVSRLCARRSLSAARQGTEAAAEFQKILDHRGIVCNAPIGAPAHLQIGRAYAMQGDTAKAKAAYQDFLTLWKDADPDIPILIAAKAEFAKLQ